MPHFKIEVNENGGLRVRGVKVALETPNDVSPTTDTPEEEIVAPELTESVLDVMEEEDTPPMEPEDSTDDDSHICVHCGKVCSSAAGLAAHIRAKHGE